MYSRRMDIVFDKGGKERPRGHALLYFRKSSDPEEIWVTYLVVLPLTVDVSKYVPPFLINQVGELGAKEISSFAFPPAPERLGSYAALEETAAKRDDDVLYGGTLDPSDIPSCMMSINEIVQQYAEMCLQVMVSSDQAEEIDEGDEGRLGVNEVIYAMMSKSDKLGELTRLVGRLRFAVEGQDANLIKEAEDDISLLAANLPPDHKTPQLVKAAKSTDRHGAELAGLYLQRCYHLVQEEYVKLVQVDERIREMESQLQPGEGRGPEHPL